MPSIRRGMRLAEVALGCSIWRGLLSILRTASTNYAVKHKFSKRHAGRPGRTCLAARLGWHPSAFNVPDLAPLHEGEKRRERLQHPKRPHLPGGCSWQKHDRIEQRFHLNIAIVIFIRDGFWNTLGHIHGHTSIPSHGTADRIQVDGRRGRVANHIVRTDSSLQSPLRANRQEPLHG